MTIRKRALIMLGFMSGGALLAVTGLPLKLPFQVCIFRRVTGLPCCGCGMTHAFCAMGSGHFTQAMHFNLAAIPLALLMAAGAGLLVVEAIRNKSYLAPAWKKSSWYIARGGGVILMVSWAINLWAAFHHVSYS